MPRPLLPVLALLVAFFGVASPAVSAQPPEIVAQSVDRPTVSLCDDRPGLVELSAFVRGDVPIKVHWSFGDGSGSEQSAPAHAYAKPGDYTVTLVATNAAGADTASLVVTVNEEGCPDCETREFHPADFTRNSFLLRDEARALLKENVDALFECREACLEIRGHAAPDERDPSDQAMDRARAVLQLYVDHGVSKSRLSLGEPSVAGSDGGEASPMRAETVVVPCPEPGD